MLSIFGGAFTGRGSHIVEESQFARTAAPKVSPAVIGNASLACNEEVENRQLDAMEEGVAGVGWQKCRGCAFMCGAHEDVCLVCGTRNQVQNQSEGTSEASRLKRAIPEPLLDDTASVSTAATDTVCDSHAKSQTDGTTRAPETRDDRTWPLPDKKTSVSTVSPAHSSNEEFGDDEEADCDSEDTEFIEDTLDIPPPEGTLVKIFNEDDEWQPATVLKVSGTKARVHLEDGEKVVVDFSIHAVRLAHPDEACDDEEEVIPGTLDCVPPAGTLVEVLHENDQWEPMRIISSNGTVARVVDADGDEEDVDFEAHHVRLHDYAL